MVLYKCAKCGAGELEPLGDGKKAMCVYCNSVMVLPTLDPEVFNHANELRKEKKFDQAEMAFQRIVSEYPQDSESYWNLVLCRYGIEYVEERDEDDPDGAVRNYVPTCHRMSYDSILNDPDYQKALTYADGYSYRIYEEEAKKIDRILKRAAYIAQTQPAYDIFISYKESERSVGDVKDRTEDSIIAQEIYDELKKKHPGLNIFLSRITLSQVAAGLEYEPIIFSALNSAKLMILVGTSKENLESTWVKNEWSRYRKMMSRDVKKAIAVVYRGMDPKTDFPEELRMHAVQGTEARGLYLPDFVAGVEGYLGIQATAESYEAAQLYQAGSLRQISNLCLRAEQALVMNKKEDAKTYFEKVLDIEPKCARAWWGLLRVATDDMTYIDSSIPFSKFSGADKNWELVQSYANEAELAEYEREYEAYRQRWEAKHAIHKKAKLLGELKSNTKDGTYFAGYHKYGPDSEFVKELRQLIAGSEDEKWLEEFNQTYALNYAKYLELQQLKASNPVVQIEASKDYQILEKEVVKAQNSLNGAKKSMNGFFFYNVLIAAVIAGFCVFAASGHPKALDILKVTVYVVPLLSSFMVFNTIVGIFGSGRTTAKNASDSMEKALKHTLIALIPALAGYFFVQYQLFLAAKPYEAGIEWTCILAGLLYLLYAIIAVIAVVLVFVNFIFAIVFLLIAMFVVKMIPGLNDIMPISEEALRQCHNPIFQYMALAVGVVVVVRLVLYFVNSAALRKYKSSSAKLENAQKSVKKYKADAINKMKQKYVGYVAPEYLEDMG